MVPANRLALAAAAALAASCIQLADGNVCSGASDCGAGEVCTDVKECSSPELAPAWRVAWRINGSSPSSGVCSGITELSLTISSTTETQNYVPLACELGAFGFRALPIEYPAARLEARGSRGEVLGSARGSSDRRSETELVLDIEL